MHILAQQTNTEAQATSNPQSHIATTNSSTSLGLELLLDGHAAQSVCSISGDAHLTTLFLSRLLVAVGALFLQRCLCRKMVEPGCGHETTNAQSKTCS